MQETGRLFMDIDLLARRPTSDDRDKLISLLLECELVELVQKMWKKYLTGELLDQKMAVLPDHLSSSLKVCHTFSLF